MKWIGVEDRLPDDFINVLTCDAKGNIHIMYHHYLYKVPFGIGEYDEQYYPVLYWQPLPEPPVK